MRLVIMDTVCTLLLLFSTATFREGAALVTPVQVVPRGIESVNGSGVNMGCTSPLVDSGGVMVCNSTDCSSSYLLDGNSPAINTSTSDWPWASQLVTVKKNDATHDIPFDHVVLTFGFDTAVSLASIELDLFLCPEWNIGAPFISVYPDENNSLVFSLPSDVIRQYTPSQTSCDSLSTIAISFEEATTYPTWHIVVSFNIQPDTEWVHVGEVRLVDHNHIPIATCTPTLHTSVSSSIPISVSPSTSVTTATNVFSNFSTPSIIKSVDTISTTTGTYPTRTPTPSMYTSIKSSSVSPTRTVDSPPPSDSFHVSPNTTTINSVGTSSTVICTTLIDSQSFSVFPQSTPTGVSPTNPTTSVCDSPTIPPCVTPTVTVTFYSISISQATCDIPPSVSVKSTHVPITTPINSMGVTVCFCDSSTLPLPSTDVSSVTSTSVSSVTSTAVSSVTSTVVCSDCNTSSSSSASLCQPQSTSVPGDRENNNCTCTECSSSAVIGVSVVSLLLIVILATVILTQCLLIIRMMKSKDKKVIAEIMPLSTTRMDVPDTANDVFEVHKVTYNTYEQTD